jgi:2-deoxy-D-gluconate 3-dehydrogenase
MSNQLLDGRRAVITGASRGIGRAMALLFAQEGAAVAIVARSAEGLTGVAAEITSAGGICTVIADDVTDPDAAARIIGAAIAALGGVDILVNNAGGNAFTAPVQSMRMAGWRKTMELNVDATVRLIQAALPALAEGGHGSVINVASVAGLRGAPMMAHYGAAKAAVISLGRTLAIEVAPAGVRVNTLVPGWIETDLTDFLRVDGTVEQGVLARVPMARWGRPEEIAQAALFLAGEASSFMTGQELVVDGGLTAQS